MTDAWLVSTAAAADHAFRRFGLPRRRSQGRHGDRRRPARKLPATCQRRGGWLGCSGGSWAVPHGGTLRVSLVSNVTRSVWCSGRCGAASSVGGARHRRRAHGGVIPGHAGIPALSDHLRQPIPRSMTENPIQILEVRAHEGDRRVTDRRQLLGRLGRGRDQEPAPAGLALQLEDGAQLGEHGSPESQGDPHPSCSDSRATNSTPSISSSVASSSSTDDFPAPGAPVNSTAHVVTRDMIS